MPRILGIAPSRSTCLCEEDALIAAGVARRAGPVLEIPDMKAANRVAREHHRAHGKGPPFEPIA